MAIFIAVAGPAANKFLLTSSPLILIPRYVWIWIIFFKKTQRNKHGGNIENFYKSLHTIDDYCDSVDLKGYIPCRNE